MERTSQSNVSSDKTPYYRVKCGAGTKCRAVAISIGHRIDLCKKALSKAKRFVATGAQAFFQTARRRRVRRMALLTSFIVVILTIAMINFQIGYAVELDGVSLGQAGSRAEIEEVVDTVEARASEILGYAYSLGDQISVTAQLSGLTVSSQALVSSILREIDGIAELYTIQVDGRVVGAVSSYSAADDLLDQILDTYLSKNTNAVRFLQTVAIEYGLVSDDVLQDPVEIARLLDPENAASDCRLTVVTIDYTQTAEDIPYDSVYYDDDAYYEGDVVVTEEGAVGEKVVTHRTVSLNGEEAVSTITNSYVSVDPVTERVACGTAERPAYASTGRYIWPASGVVTSYFGYRSTSVGSSNHKGIDIGGSNGQSIWAADGGEVVYADWYYGYGYLVQILHDNGETTYYGHCSSLLVSVGDRVCQGQEIALMGATGVASGVHLHFEVRVNGEPVDPINCLP